MIGLQSDNDMEVKNNLLLIFIYLTVPFQVDHSEITGHIQICNGDN